MRKALVIGIDAYPGAKLDGAINDAKEVEKLLRKNGNETKNFDVLSYYDIKSKAELNTILKKFFTNKADVGVLYFSGHGFLNESGGYIVTPDYQHNDEGISMEHILKLSNQSRITNKIIILDCCNSGTLGNQIDGGAVIPIHEGTSILTACREDENAEEVNGHGIFTSLLLDALRGGAADLRGHISPGGIYAYIDQALGANDQRPVFKTNVTQFTSLRKAVPQVSIDIIKKITTFFPTPDAPYPLNPSYEDSNDPNKEEDFIQPYAVEANTILFKQLQKLQSIGLVVPVEADFMYFAAMRSKSCKLTTLGQHYWRLVKKDLID